MPYISRRHLKHAAAPRGTGYLEDGDVIADFETWPRTTRAYLLEKGDVEFRADAPQQADPPAIVEEETSGVAAAPEAASTSGTKKPTARKRTATRKKTT